MKINLPNETRPSPWFRGYTWSVFGHKFWSGKIPHQEQKVKQKLGRPWKYKYWLNYLHTSSSKGTSGFTSNTLLIKIQYCYQFKYFLDLIKVMRRMVKWSKLLNWCCFKRLIICGRAINILNWIQCHEIQMGWMIQRSMRQDFKHFQPTSQICIDTPCVNNTFSIKTGRFK